MKCSPMRASSVLGLCLALSACVAAAADPAGAQTMKVTIEGRRGGDISATTAEIDGEHRLSQRVYAYAISSSHADFDGATAMNYAQSDTGSKQGTHRGYAVWTLKNGDTVTVKFEGRHDVPQGAGSAPNSGRFDFVGGTGKYRAIKGSGSYSGTGSQAEGTFTSSVTLAY